MNAVQEKRGGKTLSVFLSYIIADRVYAHKLRGLLSQWPNLRIFTPEMLSAGEDWESKLKNELSQCDIFIVLLSSNSVDSNWILQELGAAWALNKPIVPVVTNPDVFSKIPLTLSEIQFIETKDLEKPEVINQIIEHYEKMLGLQNNG